MNNQDIKKRMFYYLKLANKSIKQRTYDRNNKLYNHYKELI